MGCICSFNLLFSVFEAMFSLAQAHFELTISMRITLNSLFFYLHFLRAMIARVHHYSQFILCWVLNFSYARKALCQLSHIPDSQQCVDELCKTLLLEWRGEERKEKGRRREKRGIFSMLPGQCGCVQAECSSSELVGFISSTQ